MLTGFVDYEFKPDDNLALLNWQPSIANFGRVCLQAYYPHSHWYQ